MKLLNRAGSAMQRGQEQRRYLEPLFHTFDQEEIRTFIYNLIKELHQFKIATFVGVPCSFNKVEVRYNLIHEAERIYHRDRITAEQEEKSYEHIDIELKLIRADLRAVGPNNKNISTSVIWLHAGRKSAIIAEKLVKIMEKI